MRNKKKSRSTRQEITENSGKTVSAKSLANLHPFAPGVSGNPGGRPRFAKFSEACRDVLSEPFDSERTVAQAIAQGLAKRALRGSLPAAQELADRAEGRAAVSLQVESKNDRLTMLLDAFREARKHPPSPPSPGSGENG